MPKRIDWNWIATGTLVTFCIGAGGLLMVFVSFTADIYPDYSTFWTAAGLSLTETAGTVLYDAERMTELQSWLVSNEDFRPWIYPPSTLLVLLPFAQLPFLGLACHLVDHHRRALFRRGVVLQSQPGGCGFGKPVVFYRVCRNSWPFHESGRSHRSDRARALNTSPSPGRRSFRHSGSHQATVAVFAPLALLAGRQLLIHLHLFDRDGSSHWGRVHAGVRFRLVAGVVASRCRHSLTSSATTRSPILA